MTGQASGREFLPYDYLDESIPALRATPTVWIVRMPGDAFALAPLYEDDEPDRFLKAGDLVAFCWTENYGTVEIDVASGGSFTVVSGTIDRRANCVRAEFDNDTIDESVESLARNWIDNGAEPGVVEFDQYFWSAGDFYRFETGPSGPRFVLAEGEAQA